MKFLLSLVILTFIFILLVRYLELAMMFAPTKSIYRTPEDARLLFRDVMMTTQDNVKINGWFVLAPRSLNSSGTVETPKRYTMLYFHGNAGNMADRLEKIKFFHDFGLNVFIIDYRGYGRSEGRPTEKGMYLDALAAYDYLVNQEKISSEEIIAYGTSLGGAAAIDLASKRPVKCLIADSTFTNAEDMSKVVATFIPSFILSVKLDSVNKVKKMMIPKLFIHSPDDHTVPYRLGQKLFEAAAEPKTFLKISGGHNDGNYDPKGIYAVEIKKFLLSIGIDL